MTPNQTTARERQVDDILAKEQAARDAGSRSAIHARLAEEDRIAKLDAEYAVQCAASAAFLERAEAAYEQACSEYKRTVDAFREARLRLWALDTILSHSGGFSDHHLGIALRHQRAAPDERDIHDGLGAAVASARKTLGG